MKKKLIIVIVILVVITFSIIFVLNFIGNRIFDELIDSQISEIEKGNSPNDDTSIDSNKNDTDGITIEQLENAKNNITETDKIKAASIIMKRLSTEEINALRKMLDGGITSEEKSEAKELIYGRLTEDELKDIETMYKKYTPN